MIDFVKNGALTADGKTLVAYIEEQIQPALDDKNPTVFNSMSGALKHYAVNVSLGGMVTPERWIEDYQRSAEMLWDAKLAAEAQAQTQENAQEAVAGVKSLNDQFETLKKLVEEQAAELQALKEAQKPSAKGKKADKTAEDADADE